MPVVFLEGTKRELFRELGLPFGLVIVEDCQPFIVQNMGQGRNVLKNAVERELFTADEAQEVERRMAERGLPESTEAIIEVVREFSLPEGFTPEYHFQLQRGCSETTSPHGYVRDGNGDKVIGGTPFNNLLGAMANFDILTHTADFPVLEAIHLLQQMIVAGLPIEQPKIVEEGPKRALKALLTLGGAVQLPEGLLEALGLGDEG